MFLTILKAIFKLDQLVNTPYFTDGSRIVLWLSADPVSMFNIDTKTWDSPPRWLAQ